MKSLIEIFIKDFDSLASLLSNMEEKGKVDLTIVGKLDSIISTLQDYERKVAGSRGEIVSSFLAYHILRNVRLVLTKMKDRFLQARPHNDNPTVVDESLSMIPFLAESTDIALRYAGKPLPPKTSDMIIEQVRLLRESASNASMTVSSEEEFKSITEKELKEEARRLVEIIKERYIYEL